MFTLTPSAFEPLMFKMPSYKPFEHVIPKQAIKGFPKDVIGEGPFSTIIKGEYKDLPIAIKLFSLKTLSPHLASEFDVYIKAGDHPNLLKFHGICDHPGSFAMITEIGHMNLKTFINAPHFPSHKISHLVKGILKGVAYLHSVGIGHKHLKDTNVFVMGNLDIKLADFDLTRLKLEHSSCGAARCLATVRWRAPETFTREYARVRDLIEVQKPADMFSVGLLIWQMLSKKIPFEKSTEQKVVELLNSGTRPEIDPNWSLFSRKLLAHYWSFIPTSRPTAEQALYMLDETNIFLLFASKSGDTNVFAQPGMLDIVKNNIIPYISAVQFLNDVPVSSGKRKAENEINERPTKVSKVEEDMRVD